MVELYLSSDGKHTVHVSAQTPEELAKLLPKAKVIYEAVVAKYGTKATVWQGAAGGNGAAESNGSEKGNGKSASEAETPVCPVHNRPMVYREGRFGAFWSCPTRLANGRWCMVTKDAEEPGNGETVYQGY